MEAESHRKHKLYFCDIIKYSCGKLDFNAHARKPLCTIYKRGSPLLVKYLCSVLLLYLTIFEISQNIANFFFLRSIEYYQNLEWNHPNISSNDKI